MTETTLRIKSAGLENTVARVALVVNEKHPRQDQRRYAVTQVLRPWWSKFEPETWSLAGGKVADEDLPAEREYVEADLIHVAKQAAVRELREELGLMVALEDLRYVGVFDNGQIASVVFYILANERPTMSLQGKDDPMKEIDGIRWREIRAAVDDEDTFADHGIMIQAVIAELAKSEAYSS